MCTSLAVILKLNKGRFVGPLYLGLDQQDHLRGRATEQNFLYGGDIGPAG